MGEGAGGMMQGSIQYEVQSEKDKLIDRAERGLPRFDGHEQASHMVWVSLLVVSSCTVSFGCSQGFTSPAMNPDVDNPAKNNTLDVDLRLSKEDVTWFGSILNLGAGAGSVLFSVPVDRMGKRFGIMMGNACFALGWITIGCLPSIKAGADGSGVIMALFLARICLGLGIGFTCCSVGTYQVELSTIRQRGAAGTCFQLGVSTGVVFIYFGGLFFTWRVLANSCGCMNVAGLILTYFIPESPTWLVTYDRLDEARVALARVRTHDSDTEGHLAQLALLCEKTAKKKSSKLSDLKTAPRLRALGIGMGLLGLQSACGANVVMFYSNQVLGMVWADADTVNRWGTGIVALSWVGVLATVPIMDKVGRKPLLLSATIGMTLSAVVINIYFFSDGSVDGAFVVAGMFGFMAAFGYGLGAIPWFLVSEIAHPDVRGMTASICSALSWVISFAVTKSVNNLQELFGGGDRGLGWLFSIFALIGLSGTAFVWKMVPETSGKTYQEIEDELRTRG
ncbi:Sugar transporter ERD6-like 4 [Diplonema papillatum]|nr:Sugar transporter ERD6-like 4 [Diplonema papillatum]